MANTPVETFSKRGSKKVEAELNQLNHTLNTMETNRNCKFLKKLLTPSFKACLGMFFLSLFEYILTFFV